MPSNPPTRTIHGHVDIKTGQGTHAAARACSKAQGVHKKLLGKV